MDLLLKSGIFCPPPPFEGLILGEKVKILRNDAL